MRFPGQKSASGERTTKLCMITNEAVDELRLANGDDVNAVIKASNIIVARD